MHSLASPQVAGCTLVSSSNGLRHINSPLLLFSSLFSWFSVFSFFLRVIHKTPLSSAQLQLQRLNGLCIDCSFSNAAASPKKYQKRVITQGERGGWRLKREGDSCPKSGCIFNFIFAPEDKERETGEQEYHSVEGMAHSFTAIEQRQQAGGTKKLPRVSSGFHLLWDRQAERIETGAPRFVEGEYTPAQRTR